MIMPNFLVQSKSLVKSKSKLSFLTFRTRLAFVKLGQVFIEFSILYNFDLKSYICIEIDILGYIIDKVFN